MGSREKRTVIQGTVDSKKEIKNNRKKKQKIEKRKNWVSDTNGDNVGDSAKGHKASVVWVTDG